MTALLVIVAAFGFLWYLAIAVWLLTVYVLEPLGLVKDPDDERDGSRGYR